MPKPRTNREIQSHVGRREAMADGYPSPRTKMEDAAVKTQQKKVDSMAALHKQYNAKFTPAKK
jgi:hypothetical protein